MKWPKKITWSAVIAKTYVSISASTFVQAISAIWITGTRKFHIQWYTENQNHSNMSTLYSYVRMFYWNGTSSFMQNVKKQYGS
jgi:hypothetical protein